MSRAEIARYLKDSEFKFGWAVALRLGETPLDLIPLSAPEMICWGTMAWDVVITN